MFRHDAEMTELVLDFCRSRLSIDPVPLDFGGTRPPPPDTLDGLLGEEGNPPAEVLRIFADHLSHFRGLVRQHALLGVHTGRSYEGGVAVRHDRVLLILSGDLVVGGGRCRHGGESGIAHAFRHRRLTETGRRLFVSGGSNANLSALVVAREVAVGRRGDPRASRPRVAVSSEAHASVGLALRIAGLDPVAIPTEDHRMTGSTLHDALAAEASSDDVIAVVATAGTTNGGIVDDLAGVGRVARDFGLWFHVDGAYGGAALLAESARHLFDGVEGADSFVVDPHKWLFAPYDSAALLYRDPSVPRQRSRNMPHTSTSCTPILKERGTRATTPSI